MAVYVWFLSARWVRLIVDIGLSDEDSMACLLDALKE